MVASQDQVPATNSEGLRRQTASGVSERNSDNNMSHVFTSNRPESIAPMYYDKAELMFENSRSGYRNAETIPTVSHSVTNFLTSKGMDADKTETSMTSTGSSGHVSPVQMTREHARSDMLFWPSNISISPDRNVYTSPSISPLDSANTSPTTLSPMSFCSNLTMSSPPEPLPFLSQTLSPRMPSISAAVNILPPPTLFTSPLTSPGESMGNTSSSLIRNISVFGGSSILPSLPTKPAQMESETSSKSAISSKSSVKTSTSGNDSNAKKRIKRTNFTSEQISQMQSLFETDPYPDHDATENLANELKLSEKQIKIWFQNKRARNRRRGGSAQKVATNNSNMFMPRIYSIMTPLRFTMPVQYPSSTAGPRGFHPLDLPTPAARSGPHAMPWNAAQPQEPTSQAKHHLVSPDSSTNVPTSWNPFLPVTAPYGTSSLNPAIHNENNRSALDLNRVAETGHWDGNEFF